MSNNDTPFLKMKGIVKRFGALTAVDNVDLAVDRGEVLALVGENAAGKSTLIKVLTGVYQADQGEIFIEGDKVEINNRKDSQKFGIEAVYQDLALVPQLDVPGNLFLGKEPSKKILGGLFKVIDNKKLEEQTRDILKDNLNMEIENFNDPVINHSGGQQQSIAIGRALASECDLIVMDEPTASLGVEEIDMTFEIVRRLKQNNVAVIFISHNLEHVFEVCDKVLVMRMGERVGYMDIEDATRERLVSLMVHGRYEEEKSEKSVANKTV